METRKTRLKRQCDHVHYVQAWDDSAPAIQTKSKVPFGSTGEFYILLLPSGMHTKKLERYRED